MRALVALNRARGDHDEEKGRSLSKFEMRASATTRDVRFHEAIIFKVGKARSIRLPTPEANRIHNAAPNVCIYLLSYYALPSEGRRALELITVGERDDEGQTDNKYYLARSRHRRRRRRRPDRPTLFGNTMPLCLISRIPHWRNVPPPFRASRETRSVTRTANSRNPAAGLYRAQRTSLLLLPPFCPEMTTRIQMEDDGCRATAAQAEPQRRLSFPRTKSVKFLALKRERTNSFSLIGLNGQSAAPDERSEEARHRQDKQRVGPAEFEYRDSGGNECHAMPVAFLGGGASTPWGDVDKMFGFP